MQVAGMIAQSNKTANPLLQSSVHFEPEGASWNESHPHIRRHPTALSALLVVKVQGLFVRITN
jgi:hypothetical protein